MRLHYPLLFTQGLSPPTRGIHWLGAQAEFDRGSIPAYAGDPIAPLALPRPMRVYPRLRGGSSIRPSVPSPPCGLSPPTRGIIQIHSAGVGLLRSIPAYAGDPVVAVAKIRAGRVYPRLRGGSLNHARGLLNVTGLSPPTRGILGVKPEMLLRQGSIPAYAGDPSRRLGCPPKWWVYPRLRGGSCSG